HRLDRDRRSGQLDVRKPREQLTERHRYLPPGEMRAEAEVRPRPSEADVWVRVAQHIEAFGIIEHPWVTVRHAVEQHDLVALVEVVARQLEIAGESAAHERHR